MRNLKVTVNGTVYDVQVEEVGGTVTPSVSSAPAAAAPAAFVPAPEPKKAIAPKATASAGSETINSPMPGTIVRICVSAGQSVKEGEPLVVLEAMKMENEIMAPHDATVDAIFVNKGDSVESGIPLVSLR